MSLLNFNVQVGSLLIGPGTNFGLVSCTMLDTPDMQTTYDQDRARAHGAFNNPDWATARNFEIDVEVYPNGPLTFAAAVQALKAAMVPGVVMPVTAQLPTYSTTLTANAKLRKFSMPVDFALAVGRANAKSLWRAPDPLLYGPAQSPTTNLASSLGGLSYPLSYPLSYGTTTSSGRITITNTGTAPIYPSYSATGLIDAQGFVITCLEDGVSLTYNGPLGTSDTLTISASGGGAVTLNGQNDRSTLLARPQGWPVILKGATRTFAFQVPGAYSSSAALTVNYAPGFW